MNFRDLRQLLICINPVFILLIFCSCTNFTANGGDENAQGSRDLQDITLSDLQFSDLEGNTFSGAQFKGKPVFVHFWATWCRPCIKELPKIKEASAQADNVTFIFPSDEDLEKISRFQQNSGYSFRFLQLTKGFYEIGVSTLPTTYIFDEEGKLINIIAGAKEWNSDEMMAYLKGL